MRLILITLSSALLASSAMAYEPGTYRPGQPYSAVPSQDAQQCSLQCQGDAQCKGWNFVQVRQTSSGGLCEFNSRRVSPVPSGVSSSGDNVTARSHASIIPAGSRTVRVGQQAQTNTVRVGAPSSQTSSTRRVVRQPVQQQRQVQAASYRKPQTDRTNPAGMSLTEQQNRIRHQLDQAAPQRPVRQRSIQPPRPQAQPHLKHSLDGGAMAAPNTSRGPVQPPRITHNLDAGRNARMAPQPQPQPQAGPMPQARPQSAPQSRPAAPPHYPVAASIAQDKLFGSLHDDVKAPLPLTPDLIPDDPDAPIPTVTSIPTEKLHMEKIGGLAGAPARERKANR